MAVTTALDIARGVLSLQLITAGLVSNPLTYLAVWVVHTRFFHPYHDIPGPFLASITNWWYWRTMRYGIRENIQLPIHKKYGKIVRIAPDEVQISDPAALEIIYRPAFLKTEFYDSFSPGIPGHSEVFSERVPAKHAVARRNLFPLFRPDAISQYEPYMDRIIELLCQRLDGFAKLGKPVDLTRWLRATGLDLVGEMFYSKENGFGFLLDGKDHYGWMEMLDVMPTIISPLGYIPYGWTSLFLITQLLFSAQTRKGLSSAMTVQKQARQLVDGRKAQEAQGLPFRSQDFLSKLMAMARDEKSSFDEEDVVISIWDFIWAGSDSTGQSLIALLYPIVKHRDVYDKLTAEIDSALKTGQLSHPMRHHATSQLPYLTACIREGLRFYPLSGTGLPRYVPKGGCMISDRFFPAGYKVIVNANVIHFDKTIFGDDADVYNPDRWLTNPTKYGEKEGKNDGSKDGVKEGKRDGEERVAHMYRHLMNFGVGDRVCLGRTLALMDIANIIPALLSKYVFELAEPELRWRSGWFQTASHFIVTLKRREGAVGEEGMDLDR